MELLKGHFHDNNKINSKNMKNINIIKVFILLFTVNLFVSCDEGGDPDPGRTNVEAIAGDWWVIALEPDGITPAFGGDYVQFSTYNTAANDNTFWLDDHNNWMQIKSKASVDLNSLTFESEPNTPELYTDETVSVTIWNDNKRNLYNS